ncbi:hypothetical protein Tco_1199383, partial [Tanacetum coccineum]
MKDYGFKKSWHKEVVIMESINPNKNWPTRDSMYLLEALEDGTILIPLNQREFKWDCAPKVKKIPTPNSQCGVVAGVVTLVRMVRSRSGWNLPKKSGHSNYGLVALGKGASEGVLIKGGNALEKAHK